MSDTTNVAVMCEQAVGELNELRKVISERSNDILNRALKAFFAAHPEVKTIYWAQWVPVFNDGDACEFTLGDISFSPVSWMEIDGPYFGDEVEDESMSNFDFYGSNNGTDLARDANAIKRFINSIENHLETAFGSNSFIRCHPEGIEVEDYDCGY